MIELRLCQDIEFQTPYFVCEYMASMIPKNTKTILEPTPGIGNMIAAVVDKIPGVDITAPDDYFLLSRNQKFDCVIMNPPFTSKSADLTNANDQQKKMGMKLGYLILTECMAMTNNVIALMPWFTISDSDLRLQALVNYGMKSVTPLPRKTFRYARIQTVVLELERGYKGQTIFNPVFHKGRSISGK